VLSKLSTMNDKSSFVKVPEVITKQLVITILQEYLLIARIFLYDVCIATSSKVFLLAEINLNSQPFSIGFSEGTVREYFTRLRKAVRYKTCKNYKC
jgi:hypothetical protein